MERQESKKIKKSQKEVQIDKLPQPPTWVRNIVQDPDLHEFLVRRTFDAIVPLWTSGIKDPQIKQDFEATALEKHVAELMPSPKEGDLTESGELTDTGIKRIAWKFNEASNLASNYDVEYRSLINGLRNHTLDRNALFPQQENTSYLSQEATLFDHTSGGGED